MTIMLRPAKPSDLSAITALLAEFGLPTKGVVDLLDNFIVVELKGELIGVGGIEIHGRHALLRSLAIEIHGRHALLRSLAVSPQYHQRGIATMICDHLEAQAIQRDIESIYLLTETAMPFCASRSYAVIARSVAPEAIAASEGFSNLCPQTATFMRRLV
jgi:amino-acid N-acetyltransferase